LKGVALVYDTWACCCCACCAGVCPKPSKVGCSVCPNAVVLLAPKAGALLAPKAPPGLAAKLNVAVLLAG
jgi:hypothetical protein